MEPQSCFNLNAAFAGWRRELETEPNLAPEARWEVEARARDSIAELRGRGLSDEEAFCLARRRLGRLPESTPGFRRTDPKERAREQVLWIASAMFGVSVFSLFLNTFTNLCVGIQIHQLSPLRFSWVLPILAIVSLARGETRALWRPRSKVQFVIWSAAVVAFLEILCTEAPPILHGSFTRIPLGELTLYSLWPAALIALIAWLMPARRLPAEEIC